MARMSKEALDDLQNPENWEETEGEMTPAVKAPRAIVSVAFSRADFERVAQHARLHGMKTSEFIRRSALEHTRPKSVVESSISIVVEEFRSISPVTVENESTLFRGHAASRT